MNRRNLRRRISKSKEEEKTREAKFASRVKDRTLRRRIRLERQPREQIPEPWITEEMDKWLVTPEDDPESGSSDDSLTDSSEGVKRGRSQ